MVAYLPCLAEPSEEVLRRCCRSIAHDWASNGCWWLPPSGYCLCEGFDSIHYICRLVWNIVAPGYNCLALSLGGGIGWANTAFSLPLAGWESGPSLVKKTGRMTGKAPMLAPVNAFQAVKDAASTWYIRWLVVPWWWIISIIVIRKCNYATYIHLEHPLPALRRPLLCM